MHRTGEVADLASLEPEVVVWPELLLFMMLGRAFRRLQTMVERAPRNPPDMDAERGGGCCCCCCWGCCWEVDKVEERRLEDREEDISMVYALKLLSFFLYCRRLC